LIPYNTSFARPPRKKNFSPLGEELQLFLHPYMPMMPQFLAPIKDDINFLATTLSNFRMVTGLVTNCAKSHVATIRCEGIDINDILQVLPASHVSFPMRYLGFPLSVDRLRIIHFQYLEDKVTGKLVLPIGKHATMNGHSI
jgi:hypothetical protein